ncbi:MAG: septal ring lytic transglycosylase RlpA family protein [Rhodomicrobium sp.]|nr:septal ring lytic transglycosylase RlpA family protein [Rhodomicrobium sp.]
MRRPFSGSSIWGSDKPKLGPRIVQLGQPVPKGGGRYKVGEPYTINGRTYRPREVDHYDVTGVASWYGELFHGRRTANGEIYDMEALSAAHPTLPLPSYARVTNMANGRSLVVRVNDRGPYARGRIIDLSWAVASLLQAEAAGTAPVRVQYLGPAPLNGDDRYERGILARQPWAGPRVAFAASPAKALRHYGSPSRRYSDAGETSVLKRMASADSGGVPPAAKNRRSQPSADKEAKMPERPAAVTASTRPPRRVATAKAAPSARAAKKPEPRAAQTEAYYIDAGVFAQEATAKQLASILTEIAPASIEPVSAASGPGHRIRVGPFARGEEAQAAAIRIRAAGLKTARVATTAGG